MQLRKLFEQKLALLKGHFLLSSGLHSEYYLQSALLLQYPRIASQLAELIVKKIKCNKNDIDAVLSPAVGGIVIGQEIARSIYNKCRSIFTERDTQTGSMILRRGFELNQNDKVVIVEDVITTGGTTKELMKLVQNNGGKVVCVCSLVDRSGGKAKLGVPQVSLLKLDIKTYTQEDCPFCKKGIPLIKPGSRKKGV